MWFEPPVGHQHLDIDGCLLVHEHDFDPYLGTGFDHYGGDACDPDDRLEQRDVARRRVRRARADSAAVESSDCGV